MTITWVDLLDIAAGLIVVGLLLCGVYEIIALVNLNLHFTPDLPTITNLVKPWVLSHKMLALAFAAVFVGAFFWLFFHFFLSN